MIAQVELWHLARAWVNSHPVLIRLIAGPYREHMAADPADLESEALLVAYQVLSHLVAKNRSLTLMDRYFRITFRKRCIEMTLGVPLADYDVNLVPAPSTGPAGNENPDSRMVHAFLAKAPLTHRQRRIAEWILSQPRPVDIAEAGKRFGVTPRAISILLKNAISRIENGHRAVREAVPAAA